MSRNATTDSPSVDSALAEPLLVVGLKRNTAALSTLAAHVGADAAILAPLAELRHVPAAERIHADDTPVALLAKGEDGPGQIMSYVRDDLLFGGAEPPAAFYAFSLDRKAEHPERHLTSYAGIMQADAYAGFNGLHKAGREPRVDYRGGALEPFPA
jgi:transposase